MINKYAYKRMVSILFLYCILLSLTACGNMEIHDSIGTPTSEIISGSEEASTSNHGTSIDFQLRFIVDNIDAWNILDETDSWGYAVTDLNQNGRLELITSECHGTGFYSTTRIYEVNDTYDALIEYSNNLTEYDSAPDFVFRKEYDAFYADNGYHLVIEDMIKENATTYHYIDYSVAFRNNLIEYNVLRRRTETYKLTEDDTTLITQYYDEALNTIDEEAYLTLIDDLYKDTEKYRVTIGWSDPIHLDEHDNEELMDILFDSYTLFSIEGI